MIAMTTNSSTSAKSRNDVALSSTSANCIVCQRQTRPEAIRGLPGTKVIVMNGFSLPDQTLPPGVQPVVVFLGQLNH